MKPIRVSDHALLRFMNLGADLDVEQLRTQLEVSLARAAEAAERMGGGRFLIVTDGLSFVVRDNTVVTITPELSSGERARMLDRPR